MVYCGKPSKACGECRVRRTKCNFMKPNCSQCVRMGRVCSGYRDPLDTMFRDESKGFDTKRSRRKATKKALPPTSNKSSPEIDRAFAICSIALTSAPASTWDQRCNSPESLDLNTLNEDQGSVSHFDDDDLDQYISRSAKFRAISDVYFEDVGDALIDSLEPFGNSVGFSKPWSTCNTLVDPHMKHDMELIDQFYWESSANDDLATIDLSFGSSSDSGNNDCLEMDDSFDFDCFTEKAASPGLLIHTSDPEYYNTPALTTLSDSNEMQALCYFFANYVVDETTSSQGYLDYLPSLCLKEDGSSFLMDAVISLGLAGLGMRKHDPYALNSAHLKYASALRELNTALTSKDGALTDQALITVFLMGLYEINTCSTPYNIRAWTKHIQGAIAMLQLRGKKQLESAIGRQIFLQWRCQITALCHHRRLPIPDFILEWSREMLEHRNPDEAMATTLCLVTSQVCTLRADMKYFRNYSKSATAVPRAIKIDAELESWAENCPVSYERRIPTSSGHSDFMFGGYFDVYTSVTVAALWNEYRRMRILCHEIVLQHLPHIQAHRSHYPDFEMSDQKIGNQLRSSKKILGSLSQDICASVPFYFGVEMNGDGLKTGALAPKAVGGNLLLRPLYMAAEPIFVSNEVKKWVIGRFGKVAEVMGVRQASAMGHLVSIGIDPDEWENSIQD